MDDYNYHPAVCNESKDLGGAYLCKLAHALCALHHGRKCYKQASEEAMHALEEILKGDEDGQTD